MKKMEYKSYAGQVTDVDEKGVIVHAVNEFNVPDFVNDITLKGAFSKTLSESFSRVRYYLNHDQSILLGVPLEGNQTDTHLVMKSKINLNKQVGRDIYEDYKMYAAEGKSLEHSIGAFAIKSQKNGTGQRVVSEWMLREYSTLTNWGACENTPILSIKSEENPIELINFLELCLKKANYSDIRGKEIESNIAKLKSLLSEPSADTQQIEPNKEAIDYKSIISNFKIS